MARAGACTAVKTKRQLFDCDALGLAAALPLQVAMDFFSIFVAIVMTALEHFKGSEEEVSLKEKHVEMMSAELAKGDEDKAADAAKQLAVRPPPVLPPFPPPPLCSLRHRPRSAACPLPAAAPGKSRAPAGAAAGRASDVPVRP